MAAVYKSVCVRSFAQQSGEISYKQLYIKFFYGSLSWGEVKRPQVLIYLKNSCLEKAAKCPNTRRNKIIAPPIACSFSPHSCAIPINLSKNHVRGLNSAKTGGKKIRLIKEMCGLILI